MWSFIFFYHILCFCLQSKPVSNNVVCLCISGNVEYWWQFDDDMMRGSFSDDWPHGILVYHIIHEQPLILPICNILCGVEWSNVSCLVHVAETTQKRCYPVWSSSAQHGHHRTDSGQREAASSAGRAIDFPSNIYTDITIISQHHNTVLSAEASLEI